MKTKAWRLGLSLGVIGLVAASGFALAEDRVTVREFVQEIARVKLLPAESGEVALASLRAAGFAVPALGLEDGLTEGHVAAIARSMGLKVSSASPETPFDQGQVRAFVSAFGRELAPGPDSDRQESGTNSNGADPLKKGKGKKKGLTTPTDPF